VAGKDGTLQKHADTTTNYKAFRNNSTHRQFMFELPSVTPRGRSQPGFLSWARHVVHCNVCTRWRSGGRWTSPPFAATSVAVCDRPPRPAGSPEIRVQSGCRTSVRCCSMHRTSHGSHGKTRPSSQHPYWARWEARVTARRGRGEAGINPSKRLTPQWHGMLHFGTCPRCHRHPVRSNASGYVCYPQPLAQEQGFSSQYTMLYSLS
jgi:hypothetical protein